MTPSLTAFLLFALPTSIAFAQSTYNVIPGDTGSLIACKCGVDLGAFMTANPNVVWNDLQPGQDLHVPGSTPCAYQTTCTDFAKYGLVPPTAVAPSMSSSSAAAAAASASSSLSSGWITLSSISASDSPATYTIVAGDTAYNIAQHLGVTLNDLEEANAGKVADWNIIPIGLELDIPQPAGSSPSCPSFASTASMAGASSTAVVTSSVSMTSFSVQPSAGPVSVWTVASGDTGQGIASEVSVPFVAISSANPTVAWTQLSIGQTIQIPASPTALSQVTGSVAEHVISVDQGQTVPDDQYKFYSGDGSAAQGWPRMPDWLSFNALFQNVKPFIGQQCVENVTPNSDEETEQILDAILAVANETYLDPRFILAVVMQESNGCVRVKTTMSTIANPGLLQSFEGKGSCNRNGQLDDPCPQPVIKQMIVDGTASPVDGVTLVTALNQATAMQGCEPAQAFYRAARLYNSGPNSLGPDTNGDLGSAVTGATLCYASDIANRLMGWVTGPKACSLQG